MIVGIIVGIVAVAVIVGFVFVNQPSFGRAPQGERLERIKKSPHYKDGEFRNLHSTMMMTSQKGRLGAFWGFLFKQETDSASKTSADMIVMAYHDTYHMPVSITRCSNNYGPYHFPEKLIPLIINNILEGKQLPVYGKGDNVRDWLYVEDHCKAIDLVVREGKEGEVYNVGGHNEMTNIDIVKLTIKTIHDMMAEDKELRKILKKQVKDADGEIAIDWINDNLITFVKDRLGHDQRYAIDPTKIKNDLGWYPETMFAEGIVKTIKWNLDNQEWVKEVTSGDYQKYYEQMYSNR